MNAAAQSSSRQSSAPIGAALVEYGDTDASGEPRVVAEGPMRGPSLQVLRVFDTTPAVRRFVWRQNPHCVECGARVNSADDAGFVPVEGGFRVTCRERCLVKAIDRLNPTLNTFDAAVREDAAVRDLRLVPGGEEG